MVWGLEQRVLTREKEKPKQNLAVFLQLLQHTQADHLCLPASLLPDDRHVSFLLYIERTGAFPPSTMLPSGAEADGYDGQDPMSSQLLQDGLHFWSHHSKKDQHAGREMNLKPVCS